MTPEDEEKRQGTDGEEAKAPDAPAEVPATDASASADAPEKPAAVTDTSAEPAGEAPEKAEAAADTPAAESTSETAKADASPAGDAPEDDNRPKPPAGSVADLLAAALPDVTMSAYQGMTNVVVEIEPGDVTQVMTAAKEQPSLDLDYVRYLCGVDHEAEGLEVVYHLMSLSKRHEVLIKTRLPQDDPKVASVAQVWRAADWHERETRDMFGITFEGHPHLVPLLMPEDMEDQFPLRKDSPLADIEEWQGDQLPEEGVGGSKKR